MESEFQDRELVWVKMKSYPWWPGILTNTNIGRSGEIEYRIDFIGENTHIWTTLPSIKKYIEGQSEFSKTKKKKLLKCIEIAEKIHSGELPRDDLVSINEKFFPPQAPVEIPQKRPRQATTKKTKLSTVEKKVEDTIKNIHYLKQNSDISTALIKVEKIQKKISSFVSFNASFPSISKDDLILVFEEFVNYEPDAEILKYSFVLKSLKHFREEFITSNDPDLASLAKLANKLYLHWRNVAYEDYLEDFTEKIMDNDRTEE